MQSVKSPWHSTFDQFVGSIRESAIIASPFITQAGVDRLASGLSAPETVRLDVLTSLDERSLSDGSVDSAALAQLCEQVPGTSVKHLRHLHAKAYIADGHTSIVTSANLTAGGLGRNYELGVAITEPRSVQDIADDLWEYANLGVSAPWDALVLLDDKAQEARRLKAAADSAASDSARQEYDAALREIRDTVIDLQFTDARFVSNPNVAVTAQFADAIKYILRRHGPMRTTDMYPLIEILKPELCDDHTDYVSKGVKYGAKWHQRVRTAEVHLKRQNAIAHTGGRNGLWYLIEGEQQ